MEAVTYNIGVKNRAHRSENIWAQPSNSNPSSFGAHHSTIAKNNQVGYIFAYLVLEKNVKRMAQVLKKL